MRGSHEVAAAGWIERHSVQNETLVTALRRDLHRGEAETIALALELGANLVLLDEREGRHAGQRLELRVAGVVGVLLDAKSQRAVDAIRPHLDALRHKAGVRARESGPQWCLRYSGPRTSSDPRGNQSPPRAEFVCAVQCGKIVRLVRHIGGLP